jgi:hypothetical protein
VCVSAAYADLLRKRKAALYQKNQAVNVFLGAIGNKQFYELHKREAGKQREK